MKEITNARYSAQNNYTIRRSGHEDLLSITAIILKLPISAIEGVTTSKVRLELKHEVT